MPSSSFAHTMVQARSRRLDGDPSAWAHYVECCLRIEAEHRHTGPTRRFSRTRYTAARRRGVRDAASGVR